jgi:serine/threonine-protein kinase
VPELFDDRYEIGAPLGYGRFGVVDRAFDHNFQREVALKRYRRNIPVFHAYAEARILLSLSGPQILPVIDADMADDVPYVAMEVADGGSTGDALVQSPYGIRPDVAIDWVRDALIGLESTHDHGLVHRDVKPENLFRHGHRTLLGDFGVAAPVDPDGCVGEHGDPHIRAPEMVETGRADRRADVYSMGVTLYRLLTGCWPFSSNEPAELNQLIIAGGAPKVRELAPHLTENLGGIVARAMKRNPDERYQTARGFSQALGQHGVVRRRWQHVAPHAADHIMCWDEDGPGSPQRVCATRLSSGLAMIESRYAGSGRVVRSDLCVKEVTLDRVNVELRRLFRMHNR